MLSKRESSSPQLETKSPPHLNPLQKPDKVNPLTNIPYSQKYFRLFNDRQLLPAFQVKKQLMDLLETDDVIVLQGETGSGKTTQIPQFLLNSKWTNDQKIIACTQPRRIAAISVAKRVAEETDSILGQQVGYSIRFDDCSSSQTRLKYVTDGMLIRELLLDEMLSRYSVIVLDEAHERTLNTDLLLPILKGIVAKRSIINRNTNQDKQTSPSSTFSPLKLIIMSATIQVDRFVNFFDCKAPLLQIPGRTHPVEIYYSKESEKDYVAAAIRSAVQIHVCLPPGDILIFLTGEEEIEKANTEITNKINELEPECGPALVLPLFGSMSIDAQQKVFEKCLGLRKIIVATNIAETSVTIDGIVYVIDCGFAKQKLYHPRFKFESLKIAPISQASAQQRAGRAGRTCPGKCFRLYTGASFDLELPPFSLPEIMRNELSGMILNLNMLGYPQLTNFDFLEAPATETILRGLEVLQQIEAMISPSGKLTKVGEILSRFPLEPRLGKVLLTAKELGVLDECLNIVAVLTSGNWKIRPSTTGELADAKHKQFGTDPTCDLSTMDAVFKAYIDSSQPNKFCAENYLNLKVLSAALNIKTQLKQILFLSKFQITERKQFNDYPISHKIKIAFLSGFFQHVAHLQPTGTYSVLFNESNLVLIHPSSVVKTRPEFVMYVEYILTSKDFIRTVSEIDIRWLLDLYPQMFKSSNLELMSQFSRERIQRAQKGSTTKKKT